VGVKDNQMKLIKALWHGYLIFTMTLLFLNPGFSQVKIGEATSFPGVIESIPADFKFIVINEVRIYISPDTKIVNESGNILKIEELKPRFNVTIEAVRSKDGFYAKKIVVKKLKK
jgi:hypothetical protein